MTVNRGKAITAISLIAVCLYIWFAAEEFPANGHQIPQFTAGISLLLCIFLLYDAFAKPDGVDKVKTKLTYASVKQYIILLLSICYVLSIFWLGYFTSTLLFMVLGSLIVGVRNFKFIAITVVISLPLMYAFFELFLHAQLPRGWLM